MTSEEIKAVISDYGNIGEHFGDDARQCEQIIATLEIAYQLAVANEREGGVTFPIFVKCPQCEKHWRDLIGAPCPNCFNATEGVIGGRAVPA